MDRGMPAGWVGRWMDGRLEDGGWRDGRIDATNKIETSFCSPRVNSESQKSPLLFV